MAGVLHVEEQLHAKTRDLKRLINPILSICSFSCFAFRCVFFFFLPVILFHQYTIRRQILFN